MNSEHWVAGLHLSWTCHLRTLRGSGSKSMRSAARASGVSRPREPVCSPEPGVGVHNLHAALIERGEDASLVQRGVPKAENKTKPE